MGKLNSFYIYDKDIGREETKMVTLKLLLPEVREGGGGGGAHSRKQQEESAYENLMGADLILEGDTAQTRDRGQRALTGCELPLNC